MFLIKILLVVILNSAAFWLFDTKLFADTFMVSGGMEGYLFVAGIFTILNIVLHPLLDFLVLPFRLLTLGIIGFLINGLLLWILEYSVNFLHVSDIGLEISKLSTYIFAGVLLSLLNSILHALRA